MFDSMNTLIVKEYELNKYRVEGSFEMNFVKNDSVVVNGETYYKESIETKTVDAKTLDCYDVVLDDLELFGYCPEIKEYNFRYNKLFKRQCELLCNYRLSDNEYVAYWQWLYYTGKTPSWIKNVYTDSTDWNIREKISSVCRLRIFDYGFNNTLYADVDWEFIFNFQKKEKENRHFRRINEYLSRYGINIFATKESQIINNAIQLFKKQTNATY